jgi:rhodanese-related sulfurtransferase
MDIPYDERLVILDVRDTVRFAEEHAAGSLNLPLTSLADPGSMATIQETDNLYIHGEDDRQGVLAATLLKRQGFHNLRVVEGGWEAILREAGIVKEKDPGKLN